jgi:hypothetical protein
MKTLDFGRRGLGICVAAAMLAGCGGSQPAIGGAPGVIPQKANELPPDRGATRSTLLYVSDSGAGTVTFYSYPELKTQGTLTGLQGPLGLCIDPSTQDVWVVDANARELFEFEHGGTTPIRELPIKAYYPELVSCAVNPKNGDLAVVIDLFGSDPGALMIFKDGSGTQTDYQSSKIFYYDFVTYDKNGNAFIDGYGDRFQLAELPYGATRFRDVTPKDLGLQNRGGVQSVGSQLALGKETGGLIYQIADGKVTGKTHLGNACHVSQFFIDSDRVIAPNACKHGGRVSIYDYPAGGAPLKAIDGVKSPFAVVISR